MNRNINPFNTTQELEKFCKTNKINYLGVFGSFARGEATDDSDIDLIVRFKPNKKIGLFGLYRMKESLEQKLGREVDLVARINEHVEPYINKDLIDLYTGHEG